LILSSCRVINAGGGRARAAKAERNRGRRETRRIPYAVSALMERFCARESRAACISAAAVLDSCGFGCDNIGIEVVVRRRRGARAFVLPREPADT